jgi:hypothetical protein
VIRVVALHHGVRTHRATVSENRAAEQDATRTEPAATPDHNGLENEL